MQANRENTVSGEGSSANEMPILYSFRRCPYAMRARMALAISEQVCALREVVLRDKPSQMLEISPKGTVPVLQLCDGTVLEQSLDIMRWALRINDPEEWLSPPTEEMESLIAQSDGDFKHHLDRYKYATRYEAGTDPAYHRAKAIEFLTGLDNRLSEEPYLFGDKVAMADIAIFPFVRQFANTDKAWFDEQALTHLQRWLSTLLNSALFTRIMHKWPVWNEGDPEPRFPASV